MHMNTAVLIMPAPLQASHVLCQHQPVHMQVIASSGAGHWVRLKWHVHAATFGQQSGKAMISTPVAACQSWHPQHSRCAQSQESGQALWAVPGPALGPRQSWSLWHPGKSNAVVVSREDTGEVLPVLEYRVLCMTTDCGILTS